MKDFCGKELKHNDLVASKPGGRGASMRLGLIREELKTVWFSPESKGGSDMVKIETDGYQNLEEKRLEMIEARENEIKERLRQKNENKKNKIPKSKIKRFGVYESENKYDREIFLGRCIIYDKFVENVWMRIEDTYCQEGKKHIKFPEEGSLLEFWRKGYYYYQRQHPQEYRSVKHPQKFKEVFILSEDKVKELQSESKERLQKLANVTSSNFIQIVFD